MKIIESKIQKNKSLADLTSMKVGGDADYFFIATTPDDLKTVLVWASKKDIPVFVIGGGSNMIISDNGIRALVVSVAIRGIEITNENNDTVILSVGAGERWDSIVEYAVQHNWWGIENLSHIPGSMGAFAVQNVGAYGQEASQVVYEIEAFDRETEKVITLSHEDCNFSYRTSIFNSTHKGRYIILRTLMRLHKKAQPILRYPDVQKYFEDRSIQDPQIQQIRDAIIYIRDNKLPFPTRIPNTGSFFKNLLLTESEYQLMFKKMSTSFDDPVLQKLEDFKRKFTRDGQIKIPTAFLIEVCGLKNKCVGGACVHENHALVIVNKASDATADDVMNLFKYVRQIVYKKCGVKIINEPELVGFSDSELQGYFEL